MTATSTTSYRPALDAAVAAAREAAAVLREEFHRPGGPRGTAGYCDADREAETIIRQRLAAAFPDHGVRGEELPQQDRPVRDADKHLWLVDPNDGTRSEE